uniref:NADH dehydrogenase subunit 6 n=1 Tax=Wasmannia auropunctata TaxID=64793 RepID=A0A191TFW3_WASAN|nr:NADH dehydrogenase subunit 6 [Wasmannia auropunctata]ANI87504.1 NADH dehydrogenase subunit 6 [Wasmannia auropunctata]
MMKLSNLILLLILPLMIIIFLLIINHMHPITMIIYLIIYSIITAIIMTSWSFNHIYSIMIFLIMISGLLIIFLYFSSLISNEMNKITMKSPTLISFSLNIFTLTYLLFNVKMFMMYPPYYSTDSSPMFMLNNSLFSNIFNIYLYPFCNFSLLCIFFLLISLLSIIKISSIKSSSLRKLK